jgi:hypothetical protein
MDSRRAQVVELRYFGGLNLGRMPGACTRCPIKVDESFRLVDVPPIKSSIMGSPAGMEPTATHTESRVLAREGRRELHTIMLSCGSL